MNNSRRNFIKASVGAGLVSIPALTFASKLHPGESILPKQNEFTMENDFGRVKEVRLNGKPVAATYAMIDRGDGIGLVFYYNVIGEEPTIRGNFIVLRKAKGFVEVDLYEIKNTR